MYRVVKQYAKVQFWAYCPRQKGLAPVFRHHNSSKFCENSESVQFLKIWPPQTDIELFC